MKERTSKELQFYQILDHRIIAFMSWCVRLKSLMLSWLVFVGGLSVIIDVVIVSMSFMKLC